MKVTKRDVNRAREYWERNSASSVTLDDALTALAKEFAEQRREILLDMLAKTPLTNPKRPIGERIRLAIARACYDVSEIVGWRLGDFRP
jgi:hypothetical protein